MARQRLSEYRAKHLLAAAFGRPYPGLELDAGGQWRPLIAAELDPGGRYAVKVDQAVKGRLKQGLVALDVPAAKVAATAAAFFARDFRYCLVEPYAPHAAAAERYLAIRRRRPADAVLFSARGGVDINDHTTDVAEATFTARTSTAAEHDLGLAPGVLERLHTLFNDCHLTLLELNPLLVEDGQPIALDAAVEVDAEAESFVAGAWSSADLRQANLSPEEAAVERLSAHSPASFNLKPLATAGQIFVLLSGGGASLVVVDELCHQGLGARIGNYGEYSGDPSESEVAAYVRQVLALLKKSPARRKVLIIAGGVANFTDIRTTFKGIIRALGEVQAELRAAGVKVYVRRGGPHAAEGLALMREFLEQADLLGLVAGPEFGLPELVTAATTDLKGTAAA